MRIGGCVSTAIHDGVPDRRPRKYIVQYKEQAMSKPTLSDYLQRKNVRFTLAAICAFFAAQGIYLLFAGESRSDILRGGGEILLWGGWAVVNALKPYERTVPGLHIAINVGLILIVSSWIART
jgi:hypothetical protein